MGEDQSQIHQKYLPCEGTRTVMDAYLVHTGLPVTCAFGDCEAKGNVKPHSDYGGWYKSKMFRMHFRKRWFCPEHYQEGRTMDNKFYENYKTPDPEPTPVDVEAELYALLD